MQARVYAARRTRHSQLRETFCKSAAQAASRTLRGETLRLLSSSAALAAVTVSLCLLGRSVISQRDLSLASGVTA
jgi:hypothetical protein